MSEFVNKKELRKEILARRDALQKSEREEKCNQIIYRVLQLEQFQKSNKVLLYAAIRSEVETDQIYRIARELGKEVYYPVVLGDEMEFYLVDETTEFVGGVFGIREPKADEARRIRPCAEDVVLVLMPGVAFDKEGNRIGYGGGYYDKYLQRLADVLKSARICKIAVAYECQLVDIGRIEGEEHDVGVDFIITENGVVRCRK